MSGTLIEWAGGRGVTWAAPDTGSGAVTADLVAGLEGLSAKEAIDRLEGQFADSNSFDPNETVSFPGPIAEKFYWSDANIAGIQGPVGSGKTTTLLRSRLRRARERPRSVLDGVRRYKLVAVRHTYRDLWSTTIPSYLGVYPRDMGKWSGGRGDPVTHVIRFEDAHGPIEFTVEFKAFGDDIEGSIRGIQSTDMWLNEADTVPDDLITSGIGRISRFPDRWHFEGLPPEIMLPGQIVCDFNAPEDEENWTYKVFHDRDNAAQVSTTLSKAIQSQEDKAARDEGREPRPMRPIEITFYEQPGYGQPGVENIRNLEPGYYETQIALNTLAGRSDKNDRLVYNKIAALRVGDPVFEREYNARIHVSDGPIPYDPSLPLRIGLDQGFKGAAVIAQLHGFFRWRILAELHFPQERLMAHVFGQRLADLIEERFSGARIEAGWGDMAGEHGASQAADENASWNLMVGRAAGFHIRPQRIGTNRIQPRLEAVRAALEAQVEAGEPGILIDPGCTFLKRGFAARYVWDDEITSTGDKRKVPNKKYTEANVMDALQYLLLSEHRADGMSPYIARLSDKRKKTPTSRMGHNGGPKMSDDKPGLTARWDVLNPYGR